MIPTRAALFQMLSGQMAWLGQRQVVLAQNIANADTPGYRPNDLALPEFERLLANRSGPGAPLAPARTGPGHLRGQGGARLSLEGRPQRRAFEVKPDGNAVVLEEQMAKMAETHNNYQLSSNLYRKYVQMIRTALGGGSG